MIRLYHCPDARSFRCLWALEELRLPYELVSMPFPPRETTPEYRNINPLATIPTFVDGDTVLTESAAILQYLAARHAPATLAVEPGEPDYGAWLNWLHYGEATLTTVQTVVLRYKFTEPEARRLPQAVADYTQLFDERLQVVADALSRREYLCANRFTVADINLHYSLQLARFLGLGARFTAGLDAYMERLQAREAFRAARKAQKLKAVA